MNSPYIIEETQDFAVVYKPPKMHTTVKTQELYRESNENEFNTLFEWYKNQSGKNKFIKLLHRLDFETHGIVLFAKNEKCYNFLKQAQDEGEFIKEYSAECYLSDLLINDSHSSLPGFPEPPVFTSDNISPEKTFVVESYFRPFGPGRKSVRPVTGNGKKHKETAKDKGGFYRTEIIKINNNIITARIKRGFRHQIRCHLCWIGVPIKNDPLYSAGGEKVLPLDKPQADTTQEDLLALKAHAVSFPNPSVQKNSQKLKFSISPLH